MKPEPILDLASINQRPLHYFILALKATLAVYLAFTSLWLALVVLISSALSVAAIRKSKYKIRYIDSKKILIKLYSTDDKERIDLHENGKLELRTHFFRGKYSVHAANPTNKIDLLTTHSYDRAISLIRKLEAATSIKPLIGPHLFKLDPPEITANNVQYNESACIQTPKEQTNTHKPERLTPPSKPDATLQSKVMYEKRIVQEPEPEQFSAQSEPKSTSKEGAMNAKDIAIAKITIVWAALFIAVGCYGLATGQYYIPSKHSGLITGGEAYHLSALTMLLGVTVAAPAAFRLFGFNLEKHKKIFLIIQYIFVAAIFYFAFRKFL